MSRKERYEGNRWRPVLVYKPDYPRANAVGLVAEHILIAEKVLGKPLPLEQKFIILMVIVQTIRIQI